MTTSTNEPLEIDLPRLIEMFVRVGVRQLLMKRLAPNDNSKNQVYLGGSLEIANILPMGEVTTEISNSKKTSKKIDRLKASVPFYWLRPDQALDKASDAQLILYPQYPEVRLSGFLRGTQGHSNKLIQSRDEGRLLFLGVTNNRRIVAWVSSRHSAVSHDVERLENLETTGLLQHIPIGTADTSKKKIIEALRRIHLLGWINAQRMRSDATVGPCSGVNCGGYTLEAQLGILPNSNAEPDYEGWEIKGHSVESYERLSSGNLTLMTPQPTGGTYYEDGVEVFVKKYGYPDKSGKEDRLNFSSPHRFGKTNPNTGLTLNLVGFDIPKKKITSANGGIVLIDKKGNPAAVWHFGGLLTHWNRKHAKAAYVPYMSGRGEQQKYAFGDRVRLGENTDFIRFLIGIAIGQVIYDPGIKLENASSLRPRAKHRSQFRIKSGDLPSLYAQMETVDLSKR